MKSFSLLLLVIPSFIGCERTQSVSKPATDPYASEYSGMDTLATQTQAALKSAATIELFFLVPDEHYGPTEKQPNAEYFHWWEVISKQILSDEQSKQVATELVSDMEAHRRKPYADCFEPRQALRLTDKTGKTLDVVLCFRCQQLWCFENSDERIESQVGISKRLESLLNSMKKNPSP